ncbi:MAG: CDP-alcohol phosphatidyltransferase family protein [Oscillospiraceae bacterium]|nr:CDP-alcohol phosphatidyltransferase family protein [Oscillospiraceae bacterium]
MRKKSSLNIPNMLSIFRLCMIPVFVMAYFGAGEDGPRYHALIIYIIAQGTDVIDGYLARKLDQITRLGRVLDPLADKLMSFTVLICLVIVHPYLWWAAAVVFLKESLMGIGALVQYKRITEVPPSNRFGKLAIVYFYCLYIVTMLYHDMPPVALHIIVGVGVVLTLTAFATYVAAFVKQSRKPSGKEGS